MKRQISLLAALSCFAFFMFSCSKTVTKTVTVTVTDTVTNTVLDSNIHLMSGLLAYYPFNGDVNDQSGNGLNGVIHGGVTFSNGVDGQANGAALFDGTSGYIIIPDNTGKFQTNSVSVSFMVNLNDVIDRQCFVSSLNYADGSGQAYTACISTPNLAKMQFGVLPATTGCPVPMIADLANGITAANQLSTNTWYHVVTVFSDSLQSIYVNGILNTAVTRNFQTLNHCSANQQIVIGGWWSGDPIFVHGSMDEVRIYDRALNQNEITELARAVN